MGKTFISYHKNSGKVFSVGEGGGGGSHIGHIGIVRHFWLSQLLKTPFFRPVQLEKMYVYL